MKIELVKSTGELATVQEFLQIAQTCARVCYSDKGWDELENEALNLGLIGKRILPSGHHSVFEHMNLTFSFDNIPKALAMVLNNEKQYSTSEKSARYTKMDNVLPNQQEFFDKWMDVFETRISREYPESKLPGLYVLGSDGRMPVQKLAQENARYVTSVFTPTNMVHTLNLRQLGFLFDEFEHFSDDSLLSGDPFRSRLGQSMSEWNGQLYSTFRIPHLKNQTDRHLCFLGDHRSQLGLPKEVEEHFGDVYSTSYNLSFAGLAQAQRHRTIHYHIGKDVKLGAPEGFFVPKILRSNKKVTREWIRDLETVAQDDFPQGQLLYVAEAGRIEDFRSKGLLRLCGHAQNEIMESTLETGTKYAKSVPIVGDWLKPKCYQGIKCGGSCVWTGKYALDRKV